jgi:hypothetical protein
MCDDLFADIHGVDPMWECGERNTSEAHESAKGLGTHCRVELRHH